MKPTPQSIERLEKVLSAFVETGVQPEEMMEAIDAVVSLVRQSEELLKKQIADTKSSSSAEKEDILRTLQASTLRLSDSIAQLRADSVNDSQEIRRIVAEEVKRLEDSMPEEPEGYDDEELREHIAEHKAILSNLSDLILGENIRNALEALPEGEKLAIDAIEGLREELDRRIEAQKSVTALIAHRLDQIGDVSIAGVTNGQVLTYNATSGLWEAQTPSGGSGGITDGDKGDITVSGGGTVWTIDNQAVTRQKMEHIQTGHFLGRHAAGTGDVQEVSPAQARTILDINNVDNTSDLDKPISTATQTALDGKATPTDISNAITAHVGEFDPHTQYPLITSLKTVAFSGNYSDLSGTPDLTVFDEIEQYANLAAFPGTGNSAKFYLAQDTGLLYRWTGATYVVISAELALGETSSTAYRGDRGKIAYDHSQLTTGNPHNVTKSDVGLGSVPNLDTTTAVSQTHARSHAITSTSDHTATAHRVFYSDASGNITELALGASGTYLKSNGATSAPSFDTPPSGSGITRSVTVTSGNVTAGSTAATDYVYFVAGAHTVSLPAASGNTNLYTIKNNHSANITVDTVGAETIDGTASISIAPEESVQIISNGTNYFIV